MELWLQRISHSYEPRLGYKEQLCELVKCKAPVIWNDKWITSAKLKAALDPAAIIDKRKLRALKPVVKPKEIAVFGYERY